MDEYDESRELVELEDGFGCLEIVLERHTKTSHLDMEVFSLSWGHHIFSRGSYAKR